jgi:hypothetical protein
MPSPHIPGWHTINDEMFGTSAVVDLCPDCLAGSGLELAFDRRAGEIALERGLEALPVAELQRDHDTYGPSEAAVFIDLEEVAP